MHKTLNLKEIWLLRVASLPTLTLPPRLFWTDSGGFLTSLRSYRLTDTGDLGGLWPLDLELLNPKWMEKITEKILSYVNWHRETKYQAIGSKLKEGTKWGWAKHPLDKCPLIFYCFVCFCFFKILKIGGSRAVLVYKAIKYFQFAVGTRN